MCWKCVWTSKETKRTKNKQTNKQKSEGKIIKANKGRIIKYIKKNIFEQEGYCKLVRVGDFHNNNHNENESHSDRNKTLSIKEYFDEIKLYFAFKEW